MASAVAILSAVFIFLWQRGTYDRYANQVGVHTFNDATRASLEGLMINQSWEDLVQRCREQSFTNVFMFYALKLMACGPNLIRLDRQAGDLRVRVLVLLTCLKKFSWMRTLTNLTCFGGAIIIMWVHWAGHIVILLSCLGAIASTFYYMYLRYLRREEAIHELMNAGERLQWMTDKIIQYQIPPQPLPEN